MIEQLPNARLHPHLEPPLEPWIKTSHKTFSIKSQRSNLLVAGVEIPALRE
jgi:hypothetical protein